MKLKVCLNGVEVGELSKDKNGGLHFSYHTHWMQSSGTRPISLSLPITRQHFSGDVVYNFFDNLLPDNQVIRDRIQSRFAVNTGDAFDLLAAIGRDCVGAIQLSTKVPSSVKQTTYTRLSEQDVERLLSGYEQMPLGMDVNDREFRISLAGAQDKTALLQINGEWTKPTGTTPTSHILKLPTGVLPQVGIDLTDSCENEFICLELARAFGFDVANPEILFFGAQKVLSVERFDRKYASDKSWLMRLPQEDFCQAMGLPSSKKYQTDGGPGIVDCMQLLRASSAKHDRETFFKSQILFWLLAAIDGHGKNFSVFLEAGNTYRMTPLYDILSAYPMMSEDSGTKRTLQPQKIKMAMSLKGKQNRYKWSRILPRHFLSTAEHCKYPAAKAKQHLDYFADNVEDAIAQVEAKIPSQFPEYVAQSIFEGLRKQAKKINF
jgi:serine/threonine-protein kinase HipA